MRRWHGTCLCAIDGYASNIPTPLGLRTNVTDCKTLECMFKSRLRQFMKKELFLGLVALSLGLIVFRCVESYCESTVLMQLPGLEIVFIACDHIIIGDTSGTRRKATQQHLRWLTFFFFFKERMSCLRSDSNPHHCTL